MIATDAHLMSAAPTARRNTATMDGPVRRALRRGAINPWTIEDSLRDMSARDMLCLATATVTEGLADVLLTRVFWKALVDRVCATVGATSDDVPWTAHPVRELLELLPAAGPPVPVGARSRSAGVPGTLVQRLVIRVAAAASRGTRAGRHRAVDQASMSDAVTAIISDFPHALGMRWEHSRGEGVGGSGDARGRGLEGGGHDRSGGSGRASTPRGSRRQQAASDATPTHTTLCLSLARGGHAEALRRVLLAWREDPAFPVSMRRAFACRGCTALHEAAGAGRLDVCALLVERGVCSPRALHRYLTPLDVAAVNGHFDVALYLVCAARAPLSRMAFECVMPPPKRRARPSCCAAPQPRASGSPPTRDRRRRDAREALALIMLEREPGLCVGSIAPWDAPDTLTLDGLLLRSTLLRSPQESLLSHCEMQAVLGGTPRAQTFAFLFRSPVRGGGGGEKVAATSESQRRGEALRDLLFPHLRRAAAGGGAGTTAPARNRLGATAWSEILFMSEIFPRRATVDAYERVVRGADLLDGAVHT